MYSVENYKIEKRANEQVGTLLEWFKVVWSLVKFRIRKLKRSLHTQKQHLYLKILMLRKPCPLFTTNMLLLT